MTDLEFVELAIRRASGKARLSYQEKKDPGDLFTYEILEKLAYEFTLINEEIAERKKNETSNR